MTTDPPQRVGLVAGLALHGVDEGDARRQSGRVRPGRGVNRRRRRLAACREYHGSDGKRNGNAQVHHDSSNQPAAASDFRSAVLRANEPRLSSPAG